MVTNLPSRSESASDMATDLGHARLRRAIVGGGFHPSTNPVQESDPIVLKFDKKKRSPKRMKVHPELEQSQCRHDQINTKRRKYQNIKYKIDDMRYTAEITAPL